MEFLSGIDRAQYHSEGGRDSHSRDLVRRRHRSGHHHRVPAFVLSHIGERRDWDGTRAAGRVAGPWRLALASHPVGRAAQVDALFLCLAQSRNHSGLRRADRRGDGCRQQRHRPLDARGVVTFRGAALPLLACW